MDFVKMHGLGNDFVVISGPSEPDAGQVAAWCDRRRGVGADGVLVVTPLGDESVRMEYWNADGSPAELCGNGLRCVARYAMDEDMVSGPRFIVQTPVGERPVTVREDGTVRALLGRVGEADAGPMDVAGYHLEPIRVGNPHAVLPWR